MSFPISVEQVVKCVFENNRWHGRAMLPDSRHPQPVIIFKVDDDFVLISALCPHQGYDLSNEARIGSQITCPLHGLSVDIENNDDKKYRVIAVADGFSIIGLFNDAE